MSLAFPRIGVLRGPPLIPLNPVVLRQTSRMLRHVGFSVARLGQGYYAQFDFADGDRCGFGRLWSAI